MIRLLHTSDWHLGRHLYGRSLIEDQDFALIQLIDLIKIRRPHGLLIAGDIFDRSVPPEEAVTLLNRFLDTVIRELGLPVFIIPGNHDSKERVGFAASLLRTHHLTIFARLEDALAPVTLEGDDGVKARIFGIPFVEPMEIGHFLGNEALRTHDESVKALCAKMRELQEPTLPSVLLCHAFARGGEVSDSEKEIAIGGSSQVEASAFEGFSYTALGHLHKPQLVGSERVRYSGSLLAYSKSEVGHAKSITEVRIDLTGAIALEELSLPALRGLRYLEGTIAELVETGKADPKREDYIIAGFTDRGAQLDTFAKLRAIYPNLLHVARAGGYLPTELPAAARGAREEKADLDLFADFFRETTGADLCDDERAALAEILERMRLEEAAG